MSYTLVSLIIHDANYLDCVHYFSFIFNTGIGIWWHCDNKKITQVSDLPQGVYIIDTHKKQQQQQK